MNESLSELDWERFILDELPEERSRTLERLWLGSPELQRKVEGLERSNREVLARYPADSVVPKIRERCRRAPEMLPSRSRLLKRFLFLSPALAAALVLIYVLLPTRRVDVPLGPGGTPGDSQTVKGTPSSGTGRTRLLVFRQKDRNVEEMRSGQTARAGDLMQLAYVAAERYGVILSLDGNGAVSLHFPDRVEADTCLELDKRIPLPISIELDDAPSFERFFFVTSAIPVDVQAVLKSAGDLARDPRRAETADLNLPPGMEQTSVLIRK